MQKCTDHLSRFETAAQRSSAHKSFANLLLCLRKFLKLRTSSSSSLLRSPAIHIFFAYIYTIYMSKPYLDFVIALLEVISEAPGLLVSRRQRHVLVVVPLEQDEPATTDICTMHLVLKSRLISVKALCTSPSSLC